MDISKIVLITGATGSVGRVISSTMAETRLRLVLTGRSQGPLEELAAKLDPLGDRILPFSADLTGEADVKRLIDAISTRWSGVDILLNIAGGWSGGVSLGEMSEEDWVSALDMNLRSAFLINRAVIPYMVRRGWGRIVNFASKAAESPSPKQAGYNVAKAGIIALTASIAADYRRKGIAANAIMPSIIDTPNNRKQMPEADFSRWVTPAELAELVLFLCSEQGGSLNGASIPIYGRV